MQQQWQHMLAMPGVLQDKLSDHEKLGQTNTHTSALR